MKTKERTELDFLWCVFVTAFESGVHGVGVWCVIERYKHNEPHKDKARACIADYNDDEKGKRHIVNIGTIRKGFAKVAASDFTKDVDIGLHRSYRDQITNAKRALDAGEVDGPLADIIVQCGLFGECRYS